MHVHQLCKLVLRLQVWARRHKKSLFCNQPSGLQKALGFDRELHTELNFCLPKEVHSSAVQFCGKKPQCFSICCNTIRLIRCSCLMSASQLT